MKTARVRPIGAILILVIISWMIVLTGCKKTEEVKPPVAKEVPVAAVGFRPGFYKSEKESDEVERVYYLLNETTVTRMVFTDDGLTATEVEGTYSLEGETVTFLSPSGSKRTYSLTPDGNLKSGLGALWVYSGPVETGESSEGSGEVIFNDSLPVKTVVAMKGVYLKGWYDEAQNLYLMRFKDDGGEKVLQAEERPGGNLFSSNKGAGNEALYGLTFHVYYLEEDGTDPITGEDGKVMTIVTVER